ncbi:MAG: hypothetical protein HOJ35_00715 [Bdellovibrionales bacterium]|jgi:esterase/lipase|nr:hypothetical protein [Bdellovibrionales bacterium]
MKFNYIVYISIILIANSCSNQKAIKKNIILQKSCKELSIYPLHNGSPHNKDRTRWFETYKMTKGIVVLIHGLNNKPSSMNPLAKMSNEQGFDVLRVALEGHRGADDEIKKITQEKWQSTMYLSYCHARKVAQKKKVPLYFIGNSLGALTNLELMINQTKTKVDYKAMILFAPAISLRPYVYLIKALKFLGPDFLIPSWTPKDYRSNDGTSNSAYNALFTNISKIEKSPWDKISKVPTLVIIDPDDELIDLDDIQDLIKTKKMNNWEILKISNKKTLLKETYHHLIIDPLTVGKEEWVKIENKIIQHLAK